MPCGILFRGQLSLNRAIPAVLPHDFFRSQTKHRQQLPKFFFRLLSGLPTFCRKCCQHRITDKELHCLILFRIRGADHVETDELFTQSSLLCRSKKHRQPQAQTPCQQTGKDPFLKTHKKHRPGSICIHHGRYFGKLYIFHRKNGESLCLQPIPGAQRRSFLPENAEHHGAGSCETCSHSTHGPQ